MNHPEGRTYAHACVYACVNINKNSTTFVIYLRYSCLESIRKMSNLHHLIYRFTLQNIRAGFHTRTTLSRLNAIEIWSKNILRLCSSAPLAADKRFQKLNNTKANHLKDEDGKEKYQDIDLLQYKIDDFAWIPIYRFPLIIPVRLFSRSKLYLTLITASFFPYITYLYIIGNISIETELMFAGTCTFSTALLYLFGHAFRRLIGSAYVSADDANSMLRISHLTFFGNRQETILPVNDLLPLTDCNANLRDIFLQVRALRNPHPTLRYPLFISLRFGGILDLDRFQHVFGVMS